MRFKNIAGIVLAAVIILGASFPGMTMFVGNTSGKSFDEEGNGDVDLIKESDVDSEVTIEYLVVESATYFLKGKAYADWLASRLETAEYDGVNYSELQEIADDSLYYMRMARYYYKLLNDRAEKTPYNEDVINKLLVFDYQTFSKEMNFNSDIFDQLKGYLEEGDVRGTYEQLLMSSDKIVDELEIIQSDLYNWRFPNVEHIWQLNQECAQMLLFGQYMAQVFYKIN